MKWLVKTIVPKGPVIKPALVARATNSMLANFAFRSSKFSHNFFQNLKDFF
jgi:hypothetical protein